MSGGFCNICSTHISGIRPACEEVFQGDCFLSLLLEGVRSKWPEGGGRVRADKRSERRARTAGNVWWASRDRASETQSSRGFALWSDR